MPAQTSPRASMRRASNDNADTRDLGAPSTSPVRSSVMPSVFAPADPYTYGPPPDLSTFDPPYALAAPLTEATAPYMRGGAAYRASDRDSSRDKKTAAATASAAAGPSLKRKSKSGASAAAMASGSGSGTGNAKAGGSKPKTESLGDVDEALAELAGAGPGSPRETVEGDDGVSAQFRDDGDGAGYEPSGGQARLEQTGSDQHASAVAGKGEGTTLAAAKKPAKANPSRRPNKKKTDGLLQYTNTFVPGSVNIKNPAGDFVQRDSNIDVIRQTSQAKARLEKETADAELAKLLEEGGTAPAPTNSLHNILIIHPGSRNLRIGRASDYYPKEVPNCIARPADAPNRGTDPPVPGSRVKRIAAQAEEQRAAKRQRLEQGAADGANGANGNGHANADEDANSGQDLAEWENPMDSHINTLREYLKEHLRLRRLSTNFDEVRRVRAANSKVKPDSIPEHNDPFRIDWTETKGRDFFVGHEALRIPPNSGFSTRWPILNRGLNTRDWASSQSLMDDIALIITETLRTELNIRLKDVANYSVVLVVPDHGDRVYVQEMVAMLVGSMGFKEIAVHQEAYAAIFCAGLSTACIVDIGASRTSITCVDEGLVNPDTRIVLNYGGNDVTAALAALLERAAFPYKELDLARAQDWLMMDNLKIKICTLEEHLVAHTPWDFLVLRPVGLTQKYALRTFDENVLAPLSWFDTRMIDFEEKRGAGRFKFRGKMRGVTDMLETTYDEATSAMIACTRHMWGPPPAAPMAGDTTAADVPVAGDVAANDATLAPAPAEDSAFDGASLEAEAYQLNGSSRADTKAKEEETKPGAAVLVTTTESAAVSANSTPVPDAAAAAAAAAAGAGSVASALPAPPSAPVVVDDANADAHMPAGFNVIKQASESALDGAIAASISLAGTENKVKAAASSILITGGSGSMKGLPAILQDRLPNLLRAKGCNIDHVSTIPPPRNLNPAFVSWKGASVMCNIDALGDMWIRRDEWEALGPRALKDRCGFL